MKEGLTCGAGRQTIWDGWWFVEYQEKPEAEARRRPTRDMCTLGLESDDMLFVLVGGCVMNGWGTAGVMSSLVRDGGGGIHVRYPPCGHVSKRPLC